MTFVKVTLFQVQHALGNMLNSGIKYCYIYIAFMLIALKSCGQKEDLTKLETYSKYRMQQIEYRDSIFILYVVKEWRKKNWYTFSDYSKMYKITNEQVGYFIGGTFYSPDKKRILVWVGEKMPNAATIEIYNKDKPEVNKLCPTGGDIIYNLSALIGYRDSVNQTWKLYPFDQQTAGCFDSKDKVINVLGQYYFGQMKNHQMYRMMQSGKNKGHKELQAYGYNLQDKDFWDKCWLFQKDTVGSYGLYPFQIRGYSCDKEDYNRLLNSDPNTHNPFPNNELKPFKNDLRDCAEPFNSPIINYPDTILKLYSQCNFH